MEHWSIGEEALRTALLEVRKRQCSEYNPLQGFLFILFPILHYSITPILPQADRYTNNPLPGLTQSRALRTRILYWMFGLELNAFSFGFKKSVLGVNG